MLKAFSLACFRALFGRDAAATNAANNAKPPLALAAHLPTRATLPSLPNHPVPASVASPTSNAAAAAHSAAPHAQTAVVMRQSPHTAVSGTSIASAPSASAMAGISSCTPSSSAPFAPPTAKPADGEGVARSVRVRAPAAVPAAAVAMVGANKEVASPPPQMNASIGKTVADQPSPNAPQRPSSSSHGAADPSPLPPPSELPTVLPAEAPTAIPAAAPAAAAGGRRVLRLGTRAPVAAAVGLNGESSSVTLAAVVSAGRPMPPSLARTQAAAELGSAPDAVVASCAAPLRSAPPSPPRRAETLPPLASNEEADSGVAKHLAPPKAFAMGNVSDSMALPQAAPLLQLRRTVSPSPQPSGPQPLPPVESGSTAAPPRRVLRLGARLNAPAVVAAPLADSAAVPEAVAPQAQAAPSSLNPESTVASLNSDPSPVVAPKRPREGDCGMGLDRDRAEDGAANEAHGRIIGGFRAEASTFGGGGENTNAEGSAIGCIDVDADAAEVTNVCSTPQLNPPPHLRPHLHPLAAAALPQQGHSDASTFAPEKVSDAGIGGTETHGEEAAGEEATKTLNSIGEPNHHVAAKPSVSPPTVSTTEALPSEASPTSDVAASKEQVACGVASEAAGSPNGQCAGRGAPRPPAATVEAARLLAVRALAATVEGCYATKKSDSVSGASGDGTCGEYGSGGTDLTALAGALVGGMTHARALEWHIGHGLRQCHAADARRAEEEGEGSGTAGDATSTASAPHVEAAAAAPHGVGMLRPGVLRAVALLFSVKRHSHAAH